LISSDIDHQLLNMFSNKFCVQALQKISN